jgi:hypothetical protein
VNATVAPPSLEVSDRCDRCGARAYIRVVLPGGGELLFCGHHGRAHREAFEQQALYVQDETGTLAGTPHIAPDGER